MIGKAPLWGRGVSEGVGDTSLRVFPKRDHEASGLVSALMHSQIQTMGMWETVSGGLWMHALAPSCLCFLDGELNSSETSEMGI